MRNPLSSLKILDFSQLLPGPFGTMLLADLGADIIRIEGPNHPDHFRKVPPFDGSTSAWHGTLNRSKRSLALDLKKAEACMILKRLIMSYDILVEQFRPGVMDRLGIGYQALSAENPNLIYCSITGYGQRGPYSQRAGHDINYLALAGLSSHIGRKDQGPLPLDFQVADLGGGSMMAIVGILSAVIHRHQTGEGQHVDISMHAGAQYINALTISKFLLSGDGSEKEGSFLNGGGYYDYYETSDGRYLSVGSIEPKFWAKFCGAINRLDLVEIGIRCFEDFSTSEDIKNEIKNEIIKRPYFEWCEIFGAEDVSVEPVLDISEALAHPQSVTRKMVVSVPKIGGGTQKQIGNPIKFSESEPRYDFVGAELGQHSQEVLSEIGFSNKEISQFRERGIIV